MKKLLVWDGDNTLWEGTLLEGDKVALPSGRLRLCGELAGRGVLQSVASRNRREDVLEVLHRFDLEPFFLAPQADLVSPKSVLIRQAMEELGLVKFEDVVFVDDEPFNCAEVSVNCSGVAWVGTWQDLEPIVDSLFSKAEYSAEDRGRVASYRAERERKRSSVGYGGDYYKFLRSCEIRLEIAGAAEADMPRVVDLVQRSNQLSSMVRTYSAGELYQNQHLLKVGRVRDKFGDYGLSAVLSADEENLYLLVISCRLQGKGIGTALLGWWINSHSGRDLFAGMHETPYNGQMKNLYQWCGFEPSEPSDGSVIYCRRAGSQVVIPDWVEVAESD